MVVRAVPEKLTPGVEHGDSEGPDIRPSGLFSSAVATMHVNASATVNAPAGTAVNSRRFDLEDHGNPAPLLLPARGMTVVDPVRPASEPAADERRLSSNLSASVGDATAFGVMVGVGETYIPAFCLAIGLGELFAGLIATVPLLLGSVLQLISPWAVQKLQSHRRWVVLCAGVQGCCFLPLVIAAWMGAISPWLAIAVSSVYWGAGLATGPAWNTWQGTMIPRSIRANFLAKRSKLQQIATMSGFLLGGVALQSAGPGGNAVPMFALLFLAAASCRLISTTCLWLQTEPAPLPVGQSAFSLRSAFRQATTGPTGAVLLLAISMQAGVYVSGPFFNPYMLKVLNFSYAEYAVLLATSFVAKFLCLPLWGRYAHRHGTRQLMWIGVFGLIPLAGGWVVSTNYWYLVGLQVVAGVAWAAYELALMLLFFETIPERERTNVLTLYNLVNSCSLVLGSALGAVVLKWGQVTPTAYLWVFGLSTLVRFIPILFLYRLPSTSAHVVDTASAPAGNATVRPLSVRPQSGSIDDPVLTS